MIKATFKNIGPIKDAELELGDLTIIAGPNNTGKSYLTYTLYSFLDFWANGELLIHRLLRHPEEYDEVLQKIAKQIEKNGTATIDQNKYKEMSDWLVKESTALFSEELIHQVFSSTKEEFKEAQFRLEWTNQTIQSETHIHSAKGKSFMRSYSQDGNLVFELGDHTDALSLKGGISFLFERTLQTNSLAPFILTAERFGISLFYKELDFTKNRLVEELQNLSDENRFDPFKFVEKHSARYAKPIKDNIDFIRDLSYIQKEKSNLMAEEINLIKDIVGGYYKIVNDEIKFISRKRGENRFIIPLHLASSSARGLCDLYFYLKHVAKLGQILIIDEPESHLSPKNQILMARLLVWCVNKGIKILITTHSDYIIKEINNLIILNSDFKKKEEFLKRYKKENYTENDHLDPTSVRAYICENRGLTRCSIDERGIDGMTVFDETIKSINQISIALDMYMDIQHDD